MLGKVTDELLRLSCGVETDGTLAASDNELLAAPLFHWRVRVPVKLPDELLMNTRVTVTD